MNIYTWMTKITERAPGMTETDVRDARELISYLEKMNAFGAIARGEIAEHDHEDYWNRVQNRRECRLCYRLSDNQVPPDDGRRYRW